MKIRGKQREEVESEKNTRNHTSDQSVLSLSPSLPLFFFLFFRRRRRRRRRVCGSQAVIASEPASPKTTLRAAAELLAVASAEEAALPSRLHGLNILRFLVRDGKIGPLMLHLADSMLQTSLRGFASPLFAVRNSSTMLFTSVLRRVFRPRHGTSDLHPMTDRDFFALMPSLHAFLLQRLALAACSAAASDPAGVNAELFPMFLLLTLVRTHAAADHAYKE